MVGIGASCGRAGNNGVNISEELTMTKSILVSLAILTLSTSAALAAQHRTHHRQAMNANAFAAAPAPASPVGWMGGVSSSDRDLYIRNLRDSGFNPKNNFNSNGTIRTQ